MADKEEGVGTTILSITPLPLRSSKMAKFSVFRDAEDDDDDEHFPPPEPKRRRTASDSRSNEEASAPPVAGDRTPEERENGGQHEPPAGGAISVILSEPDVLDCPICYDPLTIPVYQCGNGHVACSTCCASLKSRCPSCSEKIGHSRCRAIESVLESVKVFCSYKSHGCQAKVSYCSKLSHEETCVHAPYACPFHGCVFRGSPSRLSLHLNQQHKSSVTSFRFNSAFPVSIKMTDKFIILQEERNGLLFILSTHNSSMAITCVSSSLSGDNRFAYNLTARRGSNSLRFESFTEKAKEGLNDCSSANYLQVPSYFFNSSGCLRLEMCIWSKDASYPDITRTKLE